MELNAVQRGPSSEAIERFRILQSSVMSAVFEFQTRDYYLVKLDAHEQAISHRVATYLERLMAINSNVDCEYDMHLGENKLAIIEPKKYTSEFPPCGCMACRKLPHLEAIEEKEFRPDVIVHTKGKDDTAAVIKWICEKVLESYKNGITAGGNGAKVIRKGQSRRRGIPSQAL